MCKVIAIVGVHLDDIELACGGTIQVLSKKVRSSWASSYCRSKKSGCRQKASNLLGYKLVLGDLKEEDLEKPPVVKERTKIPEKNSPRFYDLFNKPLHSISESKFLEKIK